MNGISANTSFPTATLPVIPAPNQPPTAVHARLYCPTGGASFPTTPLATDPDAGEAFMYSIIGVSPNGTATMTGAGGCAALVFVPSPGFTGFTSFAIRATDSGGLTVDGFAVVQVGEACQADFNHSGVVSVQDIFDFLATYFAGCP